jgi:uncharacterized protein (DUF952 family)
MKKNIFHICLPHDWVVNSQNGFYYHPSIAQEGFIHCSTAEQLEETIQRFFGDAEKIIILEIDPHLLLNELRYEQATDIKEFFPHIYGPINIDSIVHVDARTLRR